ncbi:MAG: hypothetical protein RhofKO_00790 [Rhodothermales bacterium]
MRVLRFVPLLCLTALVACTVPDPFEGTPEEELAWKAKFDQDPSEQRVVFDLMENMAVSGMQNAYENLRYYDFTRYTRVDQRDDDERLQASEQHEVRHTMGPQGRTFEIIREGLQGEFDYGFFQNFVSTNVEAEDPGDVTPYILPDDPLYLQPEYFEAYQYRLRPDTLLFDQAARVLEIRARPDAGDDLNIRRVRLYINRRNNQLVAASLARIDLAFLFREESNFFVHIRQSPQGDWVPYNSRFETTMMMPFTGNRTLRTVSSYYDYEPAH